jgi:hypothetical protein
MLNAAAGCSPLHFDEGITITSHKEHWFTSNQKLTKARQFNRGPTLINQTQKFSTESRKHYC